MQRYKKLGPAPVFWHADNEPWEFKEELIAVGKYRYLGEWDPTSNTPHGFGFWVKSNGKTMVECYCKQSQQVGFGWEYFITNSGHLVVYQGEFQNGQVHGYGTAYFSSSIFYKGEF